MRTEYLNSREKRDGRKGLRSLILVLAVFALDAGFWMAPSVGRAEEAQSSGSAESSEPQSPQKVETPPAASSQDPSPFWIKSFRETYVEKNPVLEGGWPLFMSSRIGQVYMPGGILNLTKPILRVGASAVGAEGLIGVLNDSRWPTEWLAHFSWRLGCDQGYLGMKEELLGRSYPDLREYFFGRVGARSNHLILDEHVGTVTPLALGLFGAGQLIGQRYFGQRLVEKKLSGLNFFNKNMSRRASAYLMDEFGWPTRTHLFTRAQFLGKTLGILMGTYLGWSLNNVGWQLVHWRKASLDPFSEYTPYFGMENFGDIDHGWGILGFTVGGYLGHIAGASGSDFVLNRVFKFPQVQDRLPWQRVSGEIFRQGSAIAGNLALGMFLTVHFPHWYRKVFNKFDNDQVPSEPYRFILDLPPQQRREAIRDFISMSMDQTFQDILEANAGVLRSTQEDLLNLSHQIQEASSTSLVPTELAAFEAETQGVVASLASGQQELKGFMKATKPEWRDVTEYVVDRMDGLLQHFEARVKEIQSFAELREFVEREFFPLLPDEFFLNREKALESLSSSFKDLEAQQALSLETVKSNVLGLLVYLYPYIYRLDFARAMGNLAQQRVDSEETPVAYLGLKRDFLVMGISSLMSTKPEQGRALQERFLITQKALLNTDAGYYKQRPQILVEYNKDLDEMLQELEALN